LKRISYIYRQYVCVCIGLFGLMAGLSFYLAFIHPFAFSLIGIGLLSNTRKSRVFICLIFFIMNVLFEIGQKYKIIFIKLIPQWFSSIPILENTRDFFLKGTFAVEDLIGITLGSISAFICAEIISIRRGNCNEGTKETR